MSIDPARRELTVRTPTGSTETLGYDALVVGTGAIPVRPPIAGPDALGAADGVHLLHSMGETLDLDATLDRRPTRAATGLRVDAARFRGSLGTQVVKIFDLVVARTGLRDHEATSIGLDPVTVHSSPYDHKAEISDLDLSYTPPLGHPGTPCRSPPRPGRPTSGPNGPSRHPRSLTGVRAPPPNRRSTS